MTYFVKGKDGNVVLLDARHDAALVVGDLLLGHRVGLGDDQDHVGLAVDGLEDGEVQLAERVAERGDKVEERVDAAVGEIEAAG